MIQEMKGHLKMCAYLIRFFPRVNSFMIHSLLLCQEELFAKAALLSFVADVGTFVLCGQVCDRFVHILQVLSCCFAPTVVNSTRSSR